MGQSDALRIARAEDQAIHDYAASGIAEIEAMLARTAGLDELIEALTR